MQLNTKKENQKMSENQNETNVSTIPVEERLSVVESSGWVTSLIVNSIAKLLIENKIFTEEQLVKEMEELNTSLLKMTQEMIDEQNKEENKATE